MQWLRNPHRIPRSNPCRIAHRKPCGDLVDSTTPMCERPLVGKCAAEAKQIKNMSLRTQDLQSGHLLYVTSMFMTGNKTLTLSVEIKLIIPNTVFSEPSHTGVNLLQIFDILTYNSVSLTTSPPPDTR